MSAQDRNSRPNTNNTVNHPIAVIANVQLLRVPLSDIPQFSLGPSLYDYVRTLEDSTSSTSSTSPPGTPPPIPISVEQDFIGNDQNTSQVPISIPWEDHSQAGSRPSNANHNSFSHRSHSADFSSSPKSSTSITSGSLQVPITAPIKTSVQECIETNPVNANTVANDIQGEPTEVRTSTSSSSQVQSPNSYSHKFIEEEMETNKDPAVHRTGKGNRAEHDLTTHSSED